MEAVGAIANGANCAMLLIGKWQATGAIAAVAAAVAEAVAGGGQRGHAGCSGAAPTSGLANTMRRGAVGAACGRLSGTAGFVSGLALAGAAVRPGPRQWRSGACNSGGNRASGRSAAAGKAERLAVHSPMSVLCLSFLGGPTQRSPQGLQ